VATMKHGCEQWRPIKVHGRPDRRAHVSHGPQASQRLCPQVLMVWAPPRRIER
jgi:hypothetical protein